MLRALPTSLPSLPTTTRPPVLHAQGSPPRSLLTATTGPLHLQFPPPGALFTRLIPTDTSAHSTSIPAPFLASLAGLG